MSTVAEIELAIEKLPLNDKLRLLDSLGRTIGYEQSVTNNRLRTIGYEQSVQTQKGTRKAHSVLDIPAVSVGRILQPGFSRDGLLDEMLEDRL